MESPSFSNDVRDNTAEEAYPIQGWSLERTVTRWFTAYTSPLDTSDTAARHVAPHTRIKVARELSYGGKYRAVFTALRR